MTSSPSTEITSLSLHIFREQREGQQEAFHCNTATNSVIQDGTAYYYDKVFDQNDDTAKLYSSMARDIVKGVTSGINGTIFAYGQTSSGKTHTMLGSGAEHPGVLEMAAADIFAQIGDCPDRDFLLRVSFVEIYNENIRDLLSDSDAIINIREDPRKGVYCEASEVIIVDYESIIKTLKRGVSRRAVEATAMNDTSSRSHTIFKVIVESKANSSTSSNGGAGGESDGAVLVASLNLVDLAGSESVRHTGATGQRAKEGGKINQSLLSLSRVIHALSQPGTHVSFRDSKLTRLLQPSLSGNAKMSVVCCVTPAEKYLEETRSTLQFASRAKLVKTDAKVNEVLDESAQLKRLKKELEELKEKQKAYLSSREGEGRDGEEYTRLEAEKAALTLNLASLQEEKDRQREQLDRLRNMLVFNGSDAAASSDGAGDIDRKRAKRARETWCPGVKGEGAAMQPQQHRAKLAATTEDLNSSRSSVGGGDDSFSSRGSSVWSSDTVCMNKENQALGGNESSFDGGSTTAAVEQELRAQLQNLAEANLQLQSLLQSAQQTIGNLQDELDEANKTEELELSPTNTTAITSTQMDSSIALQTQAESLALANKQVQELSSEVSHAEELLGEMEKEHESLTLLLDESVRREEALAQAVQDADAETNALRQQLVTLEGQLEESVAELQITSCRNATADSDIAAKFSSSLEEAAAAAERIAVLEAVNKDLGEQLGAAEEAYADVVDKYESSQEEMCKIRAKVSAAEDARVHAVNAADELASQLFAAQKKGLDTDMEMQQLQEQLHQQLQSLEAAASQQLTAKEAEIFFLRSAVDKKSLEVSELQAEIKEAAAAALRAHGTAHVGGLVNNHVGESELTQQDIDTARRETERVIETMRADLGRKDSEISQLMATVAELDNKATNALQQLLMTEKAQATEADLGSKKKISQLQTAADLMRGERDSLQKKLHDAESHLKVATNSLSLKEDRLSAELSKHSQLAERLQEKQLIADRLLESVRALEERVKEAMASTDEYKLMLAAAEAQLSAVATADSSAVVQEGGSSKTELEAEIAALRQHMTEMEAESSSDSGRLKKSREEISMLKGELDRCFDELSRTEQRQSELESSKIVLAGQLKTAEQQVQELADALEEASSLREHEAELADAQVLHLQQCLAAEQESMRASEAGLLAIKEERDVMAYEVSTMQKELVALHDNIATLRSQLALTSSQDKSSDLVQEMNVLLETKFDLEGKLSAAQTELRALQEKLSDYDRATRQDQELLVLAAEKEIASIRSELEQARAAVHSASIIEHESALNDEILSIRVQCEAHENTISRVHEEYASKIEVKDKRIAHLETCKLTKEQLQKINTLKEDKKRYQEDSKIMKKQLSALKKAYDELKVSSTGTDSGRDAREVSDLQVHIAEITSKLETAQHVAMALKDKLKECSHQLQEYETERIAVIEVLEKFGIDTSGLNSIVDTSLEVTAQVDEDLACVIEKLAEKFSLLKASANSADKSSSGRIRDLEARVKDLSEEVASVTHSKQAMEERVRLLKSTHKGAMEDLAATTAEADALRARADELASGLAVAEGRLGSNADIVSSEIQCLEEENIELMKENRELRKEVSSYKQAARQLKGGASAPAADHSSICDDKENDTIYSRAISTSGKRRSTTPCKDLESSAVVASASKAITASKRSRTKAKPLVSINNATADAVEGEAAECTQS